MWWLKKDYSPSSAYPLCKNKKRKKKNNISIHCYIILGGMWIQFYQIQPLRLTILHILYTTYHLFMWPSVDFLMTTYLSFLVLVLIECPPDVIFGHCDLFERAFVCILWHFHPTVFYLVFVFYALQVRPIYVMKRSRNAKFNMKINENIKWWYFWINEMLKVKSLEVK